VSTLLAIATATDQIGVALSGADGPIASLQARQERRHGEALAPAIETLTRLAGIRVAQVRRVAVDVGPGLFTGLRVGVATAKALASALEIPIVGCSSLELLAYRHRREGRQVAAVVDARRGEVFWQLFRGMEAVTEPVVAAPAGLIMELRARGPVVVAGDGARRYADLLATVPSLELAGPASDHPSAADLAELARDRPSVPLAEITPLYLRGADVRIGWEQRDRPERPSEREDRAAGHG
jgi:tRNA threonylcarbamoyladenosine biosynthesis protein TsaB